ncbi:hypothetical protein [Paracoccus laeviglucosivorans]|uniref:Uncharacterized protein n=1 Tax=Paracoccus laeviglucosivorans TaxID=1197861 RepID=A0A521FSG8_9RHOB|nr:hypothetical protein [Paracoccus laeviglucosivorans]SMO99089.1 hypothetical protein SAMN06265221_14013 [Paracoccus laeviglucosivorans]
MSQNSPNRAGRVPKAGFFVKPVYKTKSGKLQLAIYFQAAARTGPEGETLTARPKPLLIAANALDDPDSFLQIVADVLNATYAEGEFPG